MARAKAKEVDWDAQDTEDVHSKPAKKAGKPTPNAEALARDPNGDPLWETYGIQPTLPGRVKVEQLMLCGVEDVEEIAELCDLELEEAAKYKTSIEGKWKNMATPLEGDAKAIQKGQLIAKFMAILTKLEGLDSAFPDYKHLQLKLAISEKIARLRGIDVDRKPVDVETPISNDPIKEAFSDLGADASESLFKLLNGDLDTEELPMPVIKEEGAEAPDFTLLLPQEEVPPVEYPDLED